MLSSAFIKSKLKSGLETCGKHPLATGIFAVLGLIGLVLSIVDFGIGRSESLQTDKKIDVIVSSIDEIPDKVKNQIEKQDSIEPISPLIIRDHGITSVDNWIFSKEYMGQESEWIKQNIDWTSSSPYMNFSISSDAKKHFVQLAPYLVFKMINVEYFSEEIASIYQGERGSAQELREFYGYIVPDQKIQYAPLAQSRNGEKIDYITLMPGEVEEYHLILDFLPGYIYKFKVGLHYRFEGQDNIHWLDTEFNRGVPTKKIKMAGWDHTKYEVKYHPDYAKYIDHPEYYKIDNIVEKSQKNNEEVLKSRVFKTTQVEELTTKD